MLNHLRISGLAVIGSFLLAACTSNQSTSNSTENVAFADSLAFCMGQSQAVRYWQQASADTTLRGKKAREDYLAGYRAALELINSDNSAYNEGVLAGIQSAYGAWRFSQSFDISIDTKKLDEGMTSGLVSDKAINQVVLRGQMDALKNKLEKYQAEKDREKADKELSTLISKGFKKADTGFYYHEIKLGEGELLKDQSVMASLSMRTLDGRVIMKPTEEGTVTPGSLSYTPAMNRSLSMMRPGAQYEFAGPASDFYGIGSQMPDNSIKPSTPVIWTITLGQLVTKK